MSCAVSVLILFLLFSPPPNVLKRKPTSRKQSVPEATERKSGPGLLVPPVSLREDLSVLTQWCLSGAEPRLSLCADCAPVRAETWLRLY